MYKPHNRNSFRDCPTVPIVSCMNADILVCIPNASRHNASIARRRLFSSCRRSGHIKKRFFDRFPLPSPPPAGCLNSCDPTLPSSGPPSSPESRPCVNRIYGNPKHQQPTEIELCLFLFKQKDRTQAMLQTNKNRNKNAEAAQRCVMHAEEPGPMDTCHHVPALLQHHLDASFQGPPRYSKLWNTFYRPALQPCLAFG